MLTRGEKVLAAIGGEAVLIAEARRTKDKKMPAWFENQVRNRLASSTQKATDDAVTEAASKASLAYLIKLKRA